MPFPAPTVIVVTFVPVVAVTVNVLAPLLIEGAVMAPQLTLPNPLDPLLLSVTPLTVPQLTLPNPLDPLLLSVTPLTVPLVMLPQASVPTPETF